MPIRRLLPALILLAPAALGAQDPALKDAFQQGKDLWAQSGDRAGATTRFEQVVAALSPQGKALPAPWMQLLCQSYNWLAVLDDRGASTKAQVKTRFQSLLDLNPDFELDRDITSKRLVDAYNAQRAAAFGSVRLGLDPAGGLLKVDGQPRAAAPELHLVSGSHHLAYTRPGFSSQEQDVEVHAGAPSAATLKLTRTSSTLRLFTRPSGAEVVLDGQSLGRTAGSMAPEDKPIADKAGLSPAELSAGFTISELKPGRHSLELRSSCYKTKFVDLPANYADSMADYELEAFKLDASQGTLAISSPVEGQLLIDGEDRGKVPVDNLSVCSGTHDIVVRYPAGGFSRRLEVQEGKSIALEAKPRPRLAFLGMPSGDFGGRARMADLMAALGARLNLVAYLQPRSGETPEAALARFKASHEAELLLSLRPAGEGPAAPVELSLATLEGEEERTLARPFEQDPLSDLVARLNTAPTLSEPGAGLTLVDVEGEAGPFVVAADPDAVKAGVQVDRSILSANGHAVASVAAFRELLAGPDGKLADKVSIVQGGAPVNLPVKAHPLEIPMNSSALDYPAVLAALRLQLLGAKGDEAGLVRLNEALALIHFRRFDQALEILRGARLSGSRGICQGTVEYYTGLCFQHLGASYANEAVQAFRRASQYPAATLLGPDGPLVALLAKQSLDDLKP